MPLTNRASSTSINEKSKSWNGLQKTFLALPFVIALLLNVLLIAAGRFHLHGQRIAGYGFLFGTPWAWLLDRGWVGNFHNRWLEALTVYAFILWIPAALYSSCLGLLLAGIKLGATRRNGSVKRQAKKETP
jgi:hypothetical protein